jgi:hypothetical protein
MQSYRSPWQNSDLKKNSEGFCWFDRCRWRYNWMWMWKQCINTLKMESCLDCCTFCRNVWCLWRKYVECLNEQLSIIGNRMVYFGLIPTPRSNPNVEEVVQWIRFKIMSVRLLETRQMEIPRNAGLWWVPRDFRTWWTLKVFKIVGIFNFFFNIIRLRNMGRQ